MFCNLVEISGAMHPGEQKQIKWPVLALLCDIVQFCKAAEGEHGHTRPGDKGYGLLILLRKCEGRQGTCQAD